MVNASPHPPLAPAATGITSSAIRDLLEHARRPDTLSLAGGLPAAELLPAARIAEATARVLHQRPHTALQYGPTEGEPEMRALAAAACDTVESEVLITSGSQQGLDLVCRALVGPGEPIVVSDPDYLGALQCFRSHQARLEAVPSDADGLDVGVLAQRLDAGLRPRLCYVVPNFHNPSGTVLSVERRRALVELAERYGFVVVEDDPYRELWFSERPQPVIGLGSDRVVRLRSTSKVVAPALRVGWVVAPPWLHPALVRLKQCTDLQSGSLTQLVAAEVLRDDRWLQGHLAAVRATYLDRATALTMALSTAFADRLELGPVSGGMFAWGRLAGIDTTALLPRALDHGVAFVPGAVFGVSSPDPTALRLSFATSTPEQLAVAAERLRSAVDDVADGFSGSFRG